MSSICRAPGAVHNEAPRVLRWLCRARGAPGKLRSGLGRKRKGEVVGEVSNVSSCLCRKRTGGQAQQQG